MFNFLRSLVYGSAFIGILGFWIPWLGISSGSWQVTDIGPVRWAGLILLIPGAVWVCLTVIEFAFRGHGTPAPFDPPQRLVVTGLYRYSRNPMFSGFIAALTGASIWFACPMLLGYTALLLLAMHLFVTLYEEPGLKHRFGDSYFQYMQQTPRWIPQLSQNKG